MIINIFMGLFILLLLITACYLWHERNSHFLIFNVQNNSHARRIITLTAVCLLCESLIGIVILIWGNKYLNLITLILACASILIFGIMFNQRNE